MKINSRLFLLIGLTLVLLTAACGADEGSNPNVQGTLLPALETSTPVSGLDITATAETVTTAETATGILETPTLGMTESVPTQATIIGTVSTGNTQTAGTPGIPVTGQEIVLVECQFCVDTMAHALLVLPDTATFKITSPATSTTTSSTSVTATTPTCTTVEVNNGRQVVLCSGPEMTPLTINICTDSTNCRDFPVDLLACPLVQAPPGLIAGPNETQAAPGNATATATPTP